MIEIKLLGSRKGAIEASLDVGGPFICIKGWTSLVVLANPCNTGIISGSSISIDGFSFDCTFAEEVINILKIFRVNKVYKFVARNNSRGTSIKFRFSRMGDSEGVTFSV